MCQARRSSAARPRPPPRGEVIATFYADFRTELLVQSLADVVNGIGHAFSVLAYVPFAVMLAAVATIAWRTGVLPAWPARLSAVTAALYLLMSAGIAVDGGPLVPGAALSYVLHALYAGWLLSATTVMVLRPGARPVR